MTITILQGDCLEVLRTLPDASVHSCVTDPPYHLTANKKGGTGVASVNLESPYGRSRIGTGNGPGGFMGQAWDGGDIAFRPDLWREVLRVLKPGGHLLAFSGTRTYHRMACAIEDAGFEIRDQIGWAYGQGFPKSHNLDGDWQGWGTALKPGWEPICVARKPLGEKTVEKNVQAHGTGAIHVDACRVGTDGPRPLIQSNRRSGGNTTYGDGLGGSLHAGDTILGRWPANLIHDGSEEVSALFPREAGAAAPVRKRNGDKFRTTYGAFKGDIDEQGSTFHGDKGSAARFFYCAKASKADRGEGNTHPTVKPVALMRYLIRLVTPPGGTLLDPFGGSGSTGVAAQAEGFDATLIELNPEYVEIARKRLAEDAPKTAETPLKPRAAQDDLGPLFAGGAA